MKATNYSQPIPKPRVFRKIMRPRANPCWISRAFAYYRGIHSVRLLRSWFFYEGLCQICGLEVYLDAPKKCGVDASIDHVVPLAGEGKDVNRNTALTHKVCNNAKGHALSITAETVARLGRTL